MHDAYIITSSFKRDLIESIEGYGNKLIIGTKNGQLFMYCLPSADSIHQTRLFTYFETADKKPILQMKLVPGENLLFVLTNGVINVFYIGGLHFILIHSCEETKACSIFAADVKITTSQSGETDTMISICASIKGVLKFFIWKSDSKKLEPLAKEIQLKDEAKALSWMDNIICIGYRDEYVAYNIFSQIPEKHDLIATSSSNDEDRCICLIKNSIFGITKDDFLICIDPNTFTKQYAERNRMEPIKWGSSVLGLVWDEPYVIGRTKNSVEIHVLEDLGPTKYSLIQTIPHLNNVRLLVQLDNGYVFAASQTEVWCLRMVDISLQREILLTQKKFKLAIQLTNLSSEPQIEKMETLREIRNSYARDLFANKNFANAFVEFLAADTNPYDVIHLFPASIKGEIKAINCSSRHSNMPELKNKDLEDATLALIDYLIVARKKQIYFKSPILPILDTTLLKCYLQTNDSLIAPLLRRKQCNFREAEKTLHKHQKFNELIILYQVFEEHEKALSLLRAEASIEDSSLFGPKRTVEYLLHLDRNHKNLVFQYSQWVLEKYPKDGLSIFTSTYYATENNSIPKEEVLDFLLKTGESFVLPYLEHIVHVLNDPTPVFHEELTRKYVEEIKKLNEKCNILCTSKLSEEELKQLESYRWKLFETLEKSERYCPERILQFFPSNDFFKERIQVLEKMNDHEKILVIYIQILGNVDKALEYCEKVHHNDNAILEILLQILLNPLQTSPYKGVELHGDFLKPNFEIVIQLLNKFSTKINPARVFRLLPGHIPVYRIKNYMEAVSQMNTKQKWHYSILKEILKAELLRLNEQILLHRKTHCISLTESSICKECEKHFSNEQVIVRNTNGDVVHLAC